MTYPADTTVALAVDAAAAAAKAAETAATFAAAASINHVRNLLGWLETRLAQIT